MAIPDFKNAFTVTDAFIGYASSTGDAYRVAAVDPQRRVITLGSTLDSIPMVQVSSNLFTNLDLSLPVEQLDLEALIARVTTEVSPTPSTVTFEEGWDTRVRALDYHRTRRPVEEIRAVSKRKSTDLPSPQPSTSYSTPPDAWIPWPRIGVIDSVSGMSRLRSWRAWTPPPRLAPSFSFSYSFASLRPLTFSTTSWMGDIWGSGVWQTDEGRQASPVALDQYAMLTLERLIELRAEREGLSRGEVYDVDAAGAMWDEITRLRHDLADIIVYLTHYPDEAFTRDEGAFALPMYLYNAAKRLPVFREQDMRRSEESLAREVEDAYRIHIADQKQEAS